MNKKLITLVRNHIFNNPTSYNPALWIGDRKCFMGWAIEFEKPVEYDTTMNMPECLRIHLGLTQEQYKSTCYLPSYWPEYFKNTYENSYTDFGKGKTAAMRLSHLLTTGC